MNDFMEWIVFGIPAFILAGSVHEYMHAWTAKKLGDYTATLEGRLTLNPIAHIDPWGFLTMLIARFGWMKPVPVNEYNFKHPVQGMALTAAAGPASNLVMALISSIIYRILFYTGVFGSIGTIGDENLLLSFTQSFLLTFIWVNVALMVFNLIPLPPLDGSRILRMFLPQKLRYYWESLEKFGPFILLGAFVLPPLSMVTGTLLTGAISIIVSILL